jgi:hypothetical protein
VAPNRLSRHRFETGTVDENGRLFLDDPIAFDYRERSDNRFHTVIEGETLFALAGRYFSSFERGCGFWWVIADFQPEPIHDPTIAIVAGRLLVIPSERVLQEEILSERRRGESEGA